MSPRYLLSPFTILICFFHQSPGIKIAVHQSPELIYSQFMFLKIANSRFTRNKPGHSPITKIVCMYIYIYISGDNPPYHAYQFQIKNYTGNHRHYQIKATCFPHSQSPYQGSKSWQTNTTVTKNNHISITNQTTFFGHQHFSSEFHSL